MKIIFMIVTSIISILTGCGEIKENDVNIEELRARDGILLSVRHENWGETSILDDYWVSTTYEVYYDGTLEIREQYNLTGEKSEKVTLKEEDYITLYLFGYNAVQNKEFQNQKVDASDGAAWEFEFYDEKGEPQKIYSGYTYGVTKLEDIQRILQGYKK